MEWRPIDLISQRQKRELESEGAFATAEERAKVSRRMPTWMAYFGPPEDATHEFIVDYSDLTGTQYRAAFKVQRGHTELLRDAELDPRGPKGSGP